MRQTIVVAFGLAVLLPAAFVRRRERNVLQTSRRPQEPPDLPSERSSLNVPAQAHGATGSPAGVGRAKPDPEPSHRCPERTRRLRIDGKLAAISRQYGLVIINQGLDHGVLVGDVFTVHRDTIFVARVEIDRVDPKWAAGRIVFRKLDPEVGDAASNDILCAPH